MKTLITVAGRVSAGKSEIAKRVAKEMGLHIVQSYTTRQPRPEELKNGLENSDHIFISDEEFGKLTDIAAKTEINGIRYCTTMDVLNKSDIYVIDPIGIEDLKKTVGNRLHIVQFYIYAYEDIRCQRYIGRGESKDSFHSRNISESGQFLEYENNHGYDIIIYNNGNIDDAVSLMKQYLEIILEDRKEDKAAEEAPESSNDDVQSECEPSTAVEDEEALSEKAEPEPQSKCFTDSDDVDEVLKPEDAECDTDNAKTDDNSEDSESPESLFNLGFSLDDDDNDDEEESTEEVCDVEPEQYANADGSQDESNDMSEEFSLDDDEDNTEETRQSEDKAGCDCKSENDEHNDSADNSAPDYTEAVLLD